MADIQELEIQLKRMQAMLSIHEHLMLALFDQVDDQQAVIEAFEAGTQTTADLLLAEDFSDEELEDQRIAKKLILDSLTKAVNLPMHISLRQLRQKKLD